EKMSSNELMNFLNSYLTEITPIVKENDGIIDKFIGDAIMAIFPQSPLNALYSSIQFINKIRDLNKTNELFARNQINIGIGMHTGHMTMGTIGSKQRMNTTVVGDAVNLASRIESLTKVFHVPILISEQFYNHLPEDEREFVREIDITSVKGKNYPVKIYEVFASDPPDVLIKKMELKKELEKAVHTFREGDYNSAKDLFIKCQKVCPEDPIPVIYINRCETLRIEKSTKVIQSIDQLKNKPKSVLIIDDNVALLELMQYKIRKNKFYVLNASNGKEAVLKYEQFNPEIVLTDLYMPDMDGLEVSEKIMAIAHLRKENPKIIFITSEESEEVKNQILNKGYEFLPKPIDFKELFNKIQ
ncbi:MAG: response regulator, partial [Leptospiraceae bacterium]|nr:response regulator [Leptospiraceae bacterium]